MQTLHKNGVAKASDADKLHIEILNTDKTLQHLNAQKTTALTLLGELTQLDMTHYALQIPDKEDALTYLQRIQAKLYEIENEWRDAANQDSTNVDSINKDSTNQNPHNKDSIAQDSYNAIPQNLNAQDSTTKDFLAKESKQSQRKTNFFYSIQSTQSLFQSRPELTLFKLKQEEVGLKKRTELTKSLPYIDAFFQGGYANPGLNILHSGFQGYYIVGLRLNWDISNLYSKHQQDQIIAKTKLQIDSQKQEFLLQNKLTLIQSTQNAQSILAQLKESAHIIALQERIVSTSKAQLKNGVLSVNDFISDVLKLNALRLEYNYQEIEGLMQIFEIRYHLNEWETFEMGNKDL